MRGGKPARRVRLTPSSQLSQGFLPPPTSMAATGKRRQRPGQTGQMDPPGGSPAKRTDRLWRYPEDITEYLRACYKAGVGVNHADLADQLRVCLPEARAKGGLADAGVNDDDGGVIFHPVFVAAARGDRPTMELFLREGYSISPHCDEGDEEECMWSDVADTLFIMFNRGVDMAVFRWAVETIRRLESDSPYNSEEEFWWGNAIRPNCEHWRYLIECGYLGDKPFDPHNQFGARLLRRVYEGITDPDPQERAAWERFVRFQMSLRGDDEECNDRNDLFSVVQLRFEEDDLEEDHWVNHVSPGLFRDIAKINSGDFCVRAAMEPGPLDEGKRSILMDVAHEKGWLWSLMKHVGTPHMSLKDIARRDWRIGRASILQMPAFEREFAGDEDDLDGILRECNARARLLHVGWRTRIRAQMGRGR